SSHGRNGMLVFTPFPTAREVWHAGCNILLSTSLRSPEWQSARSIFSKGDTHASSGACVPADRDPGGAVRLYRDRVRVDRDGPDSVLRLPGAVRDRPDRERD